ncbi:PD-(D/E)XK nuclease family protein [Chitinophaga sp. G-6-1-13]|uniref:PD-(D/E)XK nuclease family protein n=1 Tax=Chitinophaga fulva TaxID=2728842 RepID=A0A848GR33_9BACT|nr:PD-(D/E)XK nuclease family protein [Chitinophaga fulva]NML40854.1 PD-(D/E)XK nuclease family protein [Chitinophaga fulva]
MVEKLFAEIEEVFNEYKESTKVNGDAFNVFQILGLSTREVRTHSAFIAELLNPDGSHGKGTRFLSLFIAQLTTKRDENNECISLPIDINEKTIVRKEMSIGVIDDDYENGGNIDLIIVDGGTKSAMIIENKIYAADQRNQLLRYHNYGKKEFENFKLLYLTLTGQKATQWSTGGVLREEDYVCVSYQKDILSWLEKCQEHTDGILKGTIAQYIHLLKLLTGETTYKEMRDDINRKIRETSSTFEIAKKISEEYNRIINEQIPGNLEKVIEDRWKEVFPKTDGQLRLFTYRKNEKVFEVYISVSSEDRWHIQIWPLEMKNGQPVFGVANEAEIEFIRDAISLIRNKEYTNRSYQNRNYSVWLFSIHDIKPENQYELLKPEKAAEWASKVLNETEVVLRSFIESLFSRSSEKISEIEWNIEDAKICQLIAEMHK